MSALTCGDDDWLPYDEHLESVPVQPRPVSVGPVHLLLLDFNKITQRKFWRRPGNFSKLPSLLPVGAIADHLHRNDVCVRYTAAVRVSAGLKFVEQHAGH